MREKQPGKVHRGPTYALCVAALDERVGLLMEKLAELDRSRSHPAADTTESSYDP